MEANEYDLFQKQVFQAYWAMDYQAALAIIHQNQNKFQDKSAHW